MTAAVGSGARRVDARMAVTLIRLLESGFTGSPSLEAVLANQHLLDGLDRGEHQRYVVWPADSPLGVACVGPTGTLVVAGAPDAGEAMAEHADAGGWRVLIGDAPIADRLLEATGRGLFRRRARAREQRFMLVAQPPALPAPEGLRRAHRGDLEAVTELACLLHVEDQMGPPISRTARNSVRSRMLDSIVRGDTWVVERGEREVVAKVDISLRSARRGAQIAGVYVSEPARGEGIASRAVAAVSRQLLETGLPGVTLHVRADNTPAIRAYQHAGFADHGAWILALR